MHVAQLLFYNMYIPSDIRDLVDKNYSVIQNNVNTLYSNAKKDNVNQIRRDIQLNYLVNDDIQLSANSSYMNLSEFFDLGAIGSFIEKGVSAEGAYIGDVNATHNNFRNIFNYSLWEKTEPMNLHLKITLYSKTDPLLDVMIPAFLLMSHAGMDKIYSEANDSVMKYAVPGISVGVAMGLYNENKDKLREIQLKSLISTNKKTSKQEKDDFVKYENELKEITNRKPTGQKVYNSKLLSCLINGLVYIDIGMIKSITATYSKHTAKSQYGKNISTTNTFTGDFPIWAELDVQIESSKPAVSYMLWDSLKSSDILNRKDDQQALK